MIADNSYFLMSHIRSPFIVFEGLDRSGKTTQIAMLKEKLANHLTVTEFKSPDRTTVIGKMIDSYLKSGIELCSRSIHLLFSANRWEQAQDIINR